MDITRKYVEDELIYQYKTKYKNFSEYLISNAYCDKFTEKSIKELIKYFNKNSILKMNSNKIFYEFINDVLEDENLNLIKSYYNYIEDNYKNLYNYINDYKNSEKILNLFKYDLITSSDEEYEEYKKYFEDGRLVYKNDKLSMIYYDYNKKLIDIKNNYDISILKINDFSNIIKPNINILYLKDNRLYIYVNNEFKLLSTNYTDIFLPNSNETLEQNQLNLLNKIKNLNSFDFSISLYNIKDNIIYSRDNFPIVYDNIGINSKNDILLKSDYYLKEVYNIITYDKIFTYYNLYQKYGTLEYNIKSDLYVEDISLKNIYVKDLKFKNNNLKIIKSDNSIDSIIFNENKLILENDDKTIHTINISQDVNKTTVNIDNKDYLINFKNFSTNNDIEYKLSSFNKILTKNPHQILICNENNDELIYNIPNPNFKELKEFYISDKNNLGERYLILKFDDYESQLSNNIIEINKDLIRLKDATILYPIKYELIDKIFVITYNNNLKSNYVIDNTYNEYKYELMWDNINTAKIIQKSFIENDINNNSFILKFDKPKEINKLIFDDNFKLKYILSNSKNYIEICDFSKFNNIINHSVQEYEYKLLDDLYNKVSLKENDKEYTLFNSKVSSIKLINITRDNNYITLYYSDGTYKKYKDLINNDLLNEINVEKLYEFEDNRYFVTNYITKDGLSFSKKLDTLFYKDKINKININYFENNNYININNDFKITLHDLYYDYDYIISNKLLYEYYGNISTNYIYKNNFIYVNDKNLYSFNIYKDNKLIRSLSEGVGFFISYKKYNENLNELNENSYVNNITNDVYLDISNNLSNTINFNGLSIKLPQYTSYNNEIILNIEDKRIFNITDTIIQKDLYNNILDMNINNYYELSLYSDKLVSDSMTELINNKFKLKLIFDNNEFMYLFKNDSYKNINLLENIWKFKPMNNKLLTIKFEYYNQKPNPLNTIDFWNFKISKTNKVLLDKGIHFTI